GANPAFLALLGGSCSTSVTSLSVDRVGNLWASGTTASQDFPTVAPIGALGPGSGGFVAELNSSGSSLLFASLTGMGASTSDGQQGIYLANTLSTNAKPLGAGAQAAHIDGSQPLTTAIDTLSSAGIQSGLQPPVFLAPALAPGQLAILNGRGIGP